MKTTTNMKTTIKIILILAGLIAGNLLYAQEVNNNESFYESLEFAKRNIDLNKSLSKYHTEIDFFMSARSFHVQSDIAKLQANSHFVKTGGGFGIAFNKGGWQLGTNFAAYYCGIKENLSTNMLSNSWAVNRKLFVDQLTGLPLVFNIGVGVDLQQIIFEGIYYKEFSETAIQQIDLINGGFEPRLGNVRQVSPFARLGVEWVLDGLEKPLSLFAQIETHAVGMSNTKYEAFQNTHIKNNTQVNFGIRFRAF